jgi:hypothetical protein
MGHERPANRDGGADCPTISLPTATVYVMATISRSNTMVEWMTPRTAFQMRRWSCWPHKLPSKCDGGAAGPTNCLPNATVELIGHNQPAHRTKWVEIGCATAPQSHPYLSVAPTGFVVAKARHCARPTSLFQPPMWQNNSSAFWFCLHTRLSRCLPAIVPHVRGERSRTTFRPHFLLRDACHTIVPRRSVGLR